MILTILVINSVIAVWQDSHADKALEALMNMQAVECRLLRDGKWSTADSVNLVPGDVVQVKMGDRVPADLRVAELTSVSIMVEEAPLTGESVSVQKTIKPMGQNVQLLPDQKNMLFSSTVINYGSAIGIVVYTGMNTAIGRVQDEVKKASEEEEDTPLKKKLNDFGELLTKIIGVICFLVWAMNYSNFFDPIHGSPIKGCIYYFKIAIALAVAAIPEGLPAVITTCLALGTRKMAENNAIIRRLPSVETLGCTTVICSDKTGTLTKNQMCAVEFSFLGASSSDIKTFQIVEKSYDPTAGITGMSSEIFGKNPVLRDIAVVCALNNQASIVFNEGKFNKQGEPTEAALKVFAEKLGQHDSKFKRTTDATKEPEAYSQSLAHQYERIATLDFTSERKSMSTVIKGFAKAGQNSLLLKGAPERIIEMSASYKKADGNIANFSADEKKKLIAKIDEFAKRGLRVLGVGIVYDGGKLSDLTKGNLESKLSDISKYAEYERGGTFLGFICIRDPPRDEVKGAIEACKTAGIRVIMITGDSKETAVSIAKELRIIENDGPNISFTGTEFEGFSAERKKQSLEGTTGRVFSRVEPRHKRELVKILIEMGHIVAMTGDGVNDAPALKQAHIGIAMGITGTEVAKEASDMVLADDNFATIVKAVEEGRSIYSNMKAFIRYLISSNIGEVASIFLTAMLGVPEGFSSVQLLWVNLVTDGPPATALGFNPPDRDVMQKPPRNADDQLISRWTFIRFMVIGVYVGMATVGIFIYWYLYADTSIDGHTLVTWNQLSNWSECPNWKDFHVNNTLGLDFSQRPCEYFTKGKIKASTLSLSVLVMIEMFNAFNALSEDNSLLVIHPFVNGWLLLAVAASVGSHIFILYVPIMNHIFGIVPLGLYEWKLVVAFAFPVILIDEVLKFFGRIMNERELQKRLAELKNEDKKKKLK